MIQNIYKQANIQNYKKYFLKGLCLFPKTSPTPQTINNFFFKGTKYMRKKNEKKLTRKIICYVVDFRWLPTYKKEWKGIIQAPSMNSSTRVATWRRATTKDLVHECEEENNNTWKGKQHRMNRSNDEGHYTWVWRG